MPRQIKKSLSYFTLDCDIFSKSADLRPLLRKFKADGLAVYIHILCDVYGTGYYFKPDDYEGYILDIAEDCGITVEKVQLVLAFMADRTLLDAFSLNKNTVFTSHGIQKRYAEAMKGRKRNVAEIRGAYWILSEEEEQKIDTFYKSHPFADKSEKMEHKSEKNSDKSEIYPITEQKETERNLTEDECVEIQGLLANVVFDCKPIYSTDEYRRAQQALRESDWATENMTHLSKIHRNWDRLVSGYYKNYKDIPSERIEPDNSAEALNAAFAKLNEDL